MSATPEGVQRAHGEQAHRDAEPGLHGARRLDRAPIGTHEQPRLLQTRASSVTGMAALQRTIGNRAVSGMLAPVHGHVRPAPATCPPQPTRPTATRPTEPTTAPTSGSMTRSRFVECSAAGTGSPPSGPERSPISRRSNSRPGVSAGGRLTEAAWAAWDPGPTSEIYSSVVTAFEDFESSLGGLPPVDEVLFFATAYTVNSGTHQVEPNPGVGADFGAGHLRVYRSGVVAGATGGKGIPIGRSTAAGGYPPVVIGLGGRGTDPGAPIPLPTARREHRPGDHPRTRPRPGRTGDGGRSRDVREVPAGRGVDRRPIVRRRHPRGPAVRWTREPSRRRRSAATAAGGSPSSPPRSPSTAGTTRGGSNSRSAPTPSPAARARTSPRR